MKKIILSAILVMTTGISAMAGNNNVSTFITGKTNDCNKIQVIIIGQTVNTYKITRNGLVYNVPKSSVNITSEMKQLMSSSESNKLFETGMRISKASVNTSSEDKILSEIVLSNLEKK